MTSGCIELVQGSMEVKEVLNRVDTILFDLDGVIWRGNKPIAGAAQTLSYLRQLGKKLYFVTNNSTKSREANMEKFTRLGIDVALNEIVCSSFLMAAWLKYNLTEENPEVYVIGRKGILHECCGLNIPCIGGPEDDGMEWKSDHIPDVDHKVGAVAVGFDHHFNYLKMVKARHFLTANPECLFIASNVDSTYPDQDHEFPGTGCFVAAIRCATGRKEIVIGKPSSHAWEALMDSDPNLKPECTLMVGDRLDTDIKFGRNAGLWTLLVNSGVNSTQDALNAPEEVKPHYVAQSIAGLLN